MKNQLIFRYILPFSLGIGVFAYIIAKAIFVQITTDEAYTLTILTKETVWNLVSYADSYTNNHILNSLLCKLSFNLFGMNQLAGRLPNILSFILYFWFAWQYSRRFFKSELVGFMCLAVLLGNPYMIEFFSLARGYGMSLAFMMSSIYYAAAYVLEGEKRSLSISLAFSVLAVYAQFALLHFYLALNFLIFLFSIQEYYKTRETTQLLRGGLTQIIGAAILGLLVYAPFKAILRDSQISYYGSKNIWDDSIVSVITRSIYGQGYFGDDTVIVFKNLMVALFIIAVSNLIQKIYDTKENKIKKNKERIEQNKKQIDLNSALLDQIEGDNRGLMVENNELLIKNNDLLIANNNLLLTPDLSIKPEKDPSVFALTLMASTFFVITFQFYVFGTQYVIERTSIFLFPIIALNFPTVATYFGDKLSRVGSFVASIFIIFCIWHMVRAGNLSHFSEWWFDKNTKDVLEIMKSEYQKMQVKRPLRLNTHCSMQPSFDYYYQEQHLNWLVEPFGWNSKVDTIKEYDFYYDLNDEWDALKSRYDTLKSYDKGEYLLLKRKQ